MCFLTYRGREFRTDFSRIAEMRSLIPRKCNLMALTATANLATRKIVMKNLEMNHCYVMALNPNKVNICYAVEQKPDDLMSVFGQIILHIQEHGVKSDRTIVFCRTYDDCSAIFQFLTLELASRNVFEFRDEPGPRKFICEKFTACSSPKTKRNIIDSFTRPNGVVRIVIATVAFGMGLDTPNVWQVIHWGPAEDLELYVQETGRGGRDGAPTRVTLFYSSKDLSGAGHTTEAIRKYCTNTQECRRKVLMCQFTDDEVASPPCFHQCCDVCAMVCMCNECNTMDDTTFPVQPHLPETSSHQLPLHVCRELCVKLEHYRTSLRLSFAPATLLVGIETCTGLTNKCIEAIADNAHDITSVEDLLNLGVTSPTYCTFILNIIRDNCS